jgi:hypothetical protein
MCSCCVWRGENGFLHGFFSRKGAEGGWGSTGIFGGSGFKKVLHTKIILSSEIKEQTDSNMFLRRRFCRFCRRTPDRRRSGVLILIARVETPGGGRGGGGPGGPPATGVYTSTSRPGQIAASRHKKYSRLGRQEIKSSYKLESV